MSSSQSTAHVADGLRALGSNTNRYQYDAPEPKLLERFANPMAMLLPSNLPDRVTTFDKTLHIEAPEFTSLCPLTGQPDFACILIDYEPDEFCLESKALKLYLGSYRNHGEFHEACVARIAKDLWELLNPYHLKVEGHFAPRGGISFFPTVEYRRDRFGS